MTRSTPDRLGSRRRPSAVPAGLAGLALAAALAGSGTADAAKPGEAAAPVSAATPAAVPAEPQQTMAAFGDWVVRCEHAASPASAQVGASPSAPRRVCEAAQALVIKGQQAPVAQIAFGHVPGDATTNKEAGKGAGEALTLTVLLPVNISFSKPPRLAGSDDNGAAVLTIRRCLPGGCLADAKPTAEFLRDLRSTAKAAHLGFTDAAERTLTLPFSTRGLAQALDALARETARDAG